jgi:hypothetical protein
LRRTGAGPYTSGRNHRTETGTMELKPRPNHHRYLEILRAMTPQQRLEKAIELSETAKSLFRQGLRMRFPNKSDQELHQLYLERIEKCHNRNW